MADVKCFTESACLNCPAAFLQDRAAELTPLISEGIDDSQLCGPYNEVMTLGPIFPAIVEACDNDILSAEYTGIFRAIGKNLAGECVDVSEIKEGVI